jgi:CelD/BcsL family acetyltransferase involved in cellulose biosynthesis
LQPDAATIPIWSAPQKAMLTADTFHPSALTEADAAAWAAICAARAELDSPLLSAAFARAVGEVRQDARITVWRAGGRPAAFLAYHLRPGRLARPIGAPLSDYHALIAEEPIDVAAALSAAGLAAFRFTGLIDPCLAFDGAVGARREAYVVRLDGPAEGYLEALRARSPKRFKNYRRLDHKLEREVGPIHMAPDDRDPAALQTLIRWKRAQLARTGATDFLAQDWTRTLVQTLFDKPRQDFGGLMVSLYVGGKLAAGHFGVRAGPVFHPWIAAIDPDLADASPGDVFMPRAIAAMPELGLTTYDLGPGHEHYKAPFALARRTIGQGCATAAGPAGASARAAQTVWRMLGADGQGPAGRLRRRLDTIAALELSFGGRASSLAGALAAKAFGKAPAEAA